MLSEPSSSCYSAACDMEGIYDVSKVITGATEWICT